jgi:molybdopterin-guanine dinucleotide biosynthesis protein A
LSEGGTPAFASMRRDPMTHDSGTGKVCGAILAGGNSLRMGRDKAFIEIDGHPLISRIAALLAPITDEIVVSSNERALYHPLGFPVIPDVYPGRGPLAGLHAVMAHTRRPLVLLLACDLPHVHDGLLRSLIDCSEGYDAMIPLSSDGLAHPLSAVYRRTCLRFIESSLSGQNNRMVAFLEDSPLKVRWLRPDEGCFSDQDLVNLNFPKDLDDYLAKKVQSPPRQTRQ